MNKPSYEQIDAVKAELVRIAVKNSDKNEHMLHVTVVWTCYICQNINYSNESHCWKCGCDWKEKRPEIHMVKSN